MGAISGRQVGARRVRNGAVFATTAALSAGLLLAALAQPAAAATTKAVTVLYVATPANGGSDTNPCTQTSPCASVQHAVDASTPGGAIHVGAGTFVTHLTLTSGLMILGAGQGQTFLDGAGQPEVVRTLASSARITIADLTVQHGDGTGSLRTVGGINDIQGFLSLVRVTVTDNVGTGVHNEGGGVTLTDSTVSNNTRAGLRNFEGGGSAFNTTFTGNGVGISDEGCCGSTFTNVTIAGNKAGFSASSSSRATITASTIANNNGVGLSEGGFISPGFSITVGGTIIANNSGGNCNIAVGPGSGEFVDSGYNLESDTGASCGFTATNHDLVGTSPHLGPLQYNGGLTQTLQPAATSAVVDALPTAAGLCPATDQRKVTRPQGSACDIGSFERTTPQGVIFAVSFKNCTLLHVGYNRFRDNTVVRWKVSSSGLGQLASGEFTAIGGGSAGSKTFHFLTQPLGTTLAPDTAHFVVRFTWADGGALTVTRGPGC